MLLVAVVSKPLPLDYGKENPLHVRIIFLTTSLLGRSRYKKELFISLFQSAIDREEENSLSAFICANKRATANVSSLLIVQSFLIGGGDPQYSPSRF